jgi:hypothetical protein
MAIPLNLTDGSGNAAFSANGNGTAFSPSECVTQSASGGVPSNITVQVTITGSPTAATSKLQGSLDGTVWDDLGSTTSTTSGAMFHVSQKPVVQMRAVLADLAGGSSPTVTFKAYGTIGG